MYLGEIKVHTPSLTDQHTISSGAMKIARRGVWQKRAKRNRWRGGNDVEVMFTTAQVGESGPTALRRAPRRSTRCGRSHQAPCRSVHACRGESGRRSDSMAPISLRQRMSTAKSVRTRRVGGGVERINMSQRRKILLKSRLPCVEDDPELGAVRAQRRCRRRPGSVLPPDKLVCRERADPRAVDYKWRGGFACSPQFGHNKPQSTLIITKCRAACWRPRDLAL